MCFTVCIISEVLDATSILTFSSPKPLRQNIPTFKKYLFQKGEKKWGKEENKKWHYQPHLRKIPTPLFIKQLTDLIVFIRTIRWFSQRTYREILLQRKSGKAKKRKKKQYWKPATFINHVLNRYREDEFLAWVGSFDIVLLSHGLAEKFFL